MIPLSMNMQAVILEFIQSYGVYAIFLLMLSNGFASVPPSEAVLGFAGVLATYGHIDITSAIVAGVAGNMAGVIFMYLVGLWIGCEWLLNLKWRLQTSGPISRKISCWLPNREFIRHFEKLFSRREGIIYVGVFRCFPMIRSIVSLPAGMVKMSKGRFLFYSLVGCVIWDAFWVLLGYYLGEGWQQWSKWITIVLFIVLGVMFLYLKRRVKEKYFY